MSRTGVVFGVPRSGTTLLANIIDSHPQAICLIEPYLSIHMHGSYMHEDYGDLKENPIDFLDDIDESVGCFKETFRSTWLDNSKVNEDSIADYIQEVDESLALIRDIRAVWCSTINAWNDGRNNIDMYIQCWNDFVDFIEKNDVECIKYESILNRNLEVNSIYNWFGLEEVENFELSGRSHNQPGDGRAKRTDEIKKDPLYKWKDEISSNERKHIENKCEDGLKKFGYL